MNFNKKIKNKDTLKITFVVIRKTHLCVYIYEYICVCKFLVFCYLISEINLYTISN